MTKTLLIALMTGGLVMGATAAKADSAVDSIAEDKAILVAPEGGQEGSRPITQTYSGEDTKRLVEINGLGDNKKSEILSNKKASDYTNGRVSQERGEGL